MSKKTKNKKEKEKVPDEYFPEGEEVFIETFEEIPEDWSSEDRFAGAFLHEEYEEQQTFVPTFKDVERVSEFPSFSSGAQLLELPGGKKRRIQLSALETAMIELKDSLYALYTEPIHLFLKKDGDTISSQLEPLLQKNPYYNIITLIFASYFFIPYKNEKGKFVSRTIENIKNKKLIDNFIMNLRTKTEGKKFEINENALLSYILLVSELFEE